MVEEHHIFLFFFASSNSLSGSVPVSALAPARGLATSLDKDNLCFFFFLRHPFGWYDQCRVLARVSLFTSSSLPRFKEKKLKSCHRKDRRVHMNVRMVPKKSEYVCYVGR